MDTTQALSHIAALLKRTDQVLEDVMLAQEQLLDLENELRREIESEFQGGPSDDILYNMSPDKGARHEDKRKPKRQQMKRKLTREGSV